MYKQIFFDFDSTLVKLETLDVLACMKGIGEEVKILTEASMSGLVPIEEVFEKKVDMIAPSLEMIKALHESPDVLVDGIEDVIEILHRLGKEVFILTSNFDVVVAPYAQRLMIPAHRVVANELFHTQEGEYLGMNSRNALAHTDGKRIMIDQHIRSKQEAVMIGDSVTDLACQPSVHRFIGFGGVVVREVVRTRADVFVEDSHARALLPHLLSQEEMKCL